MSKPKLNVLLAKTDHLASIWKKGIEDYLKFFKHNQGAFRGEKKTYTPKQGTIDIPGNRSNKLVVTTVDEKLSYLEDLSNDYIDALFSQEKTNSSGIAKAKLSVDGTEFGEFTSMELLRLKSILEQGNFKEMYENLPTRTEDEKWTKTDNESYSGRNVFESDMSSGVNKSTIKESYIMPDPNIGKADGAKYVAQIGTRDSVMELGDYTHQRFSGETSHIERAGILSRRSKLLTAVIEALKVANDVEAVPSQMTAKKLFEFLHGKS